MMTVNRLKQILADLPGDSAVQIAGTDSDRNQNVLSTSIYRGKETTIVLSASLYTDNENA